MTRNYSDDDFAETLEGTAQRLNQLEELWMVVGGAAVALHGIDCGPIKDIDVVLPHRAALRLSAMFSWKNHADERSDRFRSEVLLRPDLGPVPVELLGGFQVRASLVGLQWIVGKPKPFKSAHSGFSCRALGG